MGSDINQSSNSWQGGMRLSQLELRRLAAAGRGRCLHTFLLLGGNRTKSFRRVVGSTEAPPGMRDPHIMWSGLSAAPTRA